MGQPKEDQAGGSTMGALKSSGGDPEAAIMNMAMQKQKERLSKTEKGREKLKKIEAQEQKMHTMEQLEKKMATVEAIWGAVGCSLPGCCVIFLVYAVLAIIYGLFTDPTFGIVYLVKEIGSAIWDFIKELV